MTFSQTELNLKGRADLLPMVYEAHSVGIMVRPEHPITKHAMTSKGEEEKKAPTLFGFATCMGNEFSFRKPSRTH